MTSEFDDQIALTRQSDTSYAAELSGGWRVGGE